MNLGRGFKYFLQTGATRFPETNLDLYAPRRLSTVDVIDIVSEHSYRSIATDSEPDKSSASGNIVEDTSAVPDDEEILEIQERIENVQIPEITKDLKEENDDAGCEDTENTGMVSHDSDDESWASFFKTKEEDELKLEVDYYCLLFRTLILFFCFL